MTSDEFRTYVNGWPSVSKLAADLGVERVTVHRYMSGARTVSKPVERLLRILYAHPELRASSE